ncbi:uncharacterized protein CIMG_01187 [Coccidioides immitis RS]|uniref:Uncharacterized protein n=3 Tax=Coccidioides immitis TaxID=5501 RepID=J3KIM6_COCIM|nr:uncharacterized protein CIMG_01187 [Coccidioides immitis RS]EAS35833.3 hypothetical protein CIMG_01187 [Coccidioides immitis RS]KMP01122.1 hypothetical protein CIRG_01262 [Coccidioides immitis RMSCC 2394]KMU74295.1 hypothetical protein CISG_04644 [Coccidioides immitis RMSCC 3703]TPX25964.1 hypothetical protein DIZ76_011422 [Coccidioides immitis]
MGICASCLGLARRESHDSEASRLLDDDVYQPGYSYGTVQAQRHGPDPEDLKREREALEAICQRTSDSVIDIWAVQSQPLVPPAQSSTATTASSSRLPSNDRANVVSPTLLSKGEDASALAHPTHPQERADRSPSPLPGEIPGMKYVACRDAGLGEATELSTVPRHWGEVVMTNRRGRKKRPGINGTNEDGTTADDFFGALVVK